MKRLLALAPAALLALAGCGDSCQSKAAAVDQVSGGCANVAAGSQVTFNVQLCPACTDSSPTCTAEVRGDIIEVNSVVQQCSQQSGCSITGCNISPVTCPVDQPLTAGTQYTVQYNNASGTISQTTITAQSGGASSCTL